jgi:hypothetical protein
MSGKSRRGHAKHISQSKKKRSRVSHPTIAVQQPVAAAAAAAAPEPAVAAKVVAPVSKASTPTRKPSAISYPLVSVELRRIGILAGIMLVVLVVLSIVLS